jgi:hypothetical protein
MDHTHQHDDPTPRRGKWVLIGFLLIAGFFLLTEHRAHLLGILPYLLILACPLMHLFHHGHGHHGGSVPDPNNVQPEQEHAGERP